LRRRGLRRRPGPAADATIHVADVLLAASLGSAFMALTYSNYRREIDRAYERISTGSQVAETPCGPIEYAATGEGSPLLCVHGAGGGFDQGLELAEPLARSGFRVIAISRFGYLRTPLPPDASAAAQADALACILDALHIERAAILGASAGGPSAMQFALRHPDRTAALVLLVPAAYAPRSGKLRSARMPRGTALMFDGALRSDFLFWAVGKLARETFARAILGTPPAVAASASADERARLERIAEHILPVRPRRLGLLNDAAVTFSLPRYEIESIRAPTLAISAADDLYGTFEGARYTAEHVPHARFIGYPSGGHMLVGHHAEASSKIVGFLKESAGL
jgi:pimeloyl-ACP methyl ester carboxylesterase